MTYLLRMATLTIRNLPDRVRDRLRVRAAKNGVSMEAEVRGILSTAVTPEGERPVTAAAVTELQDWIAATRKTTKSQRAGSSALIQERRREAIMEAVADGLDPQSLFKDDYARVLSEAGWTKADVEALRRLHL